MDDFPDNRTTEELYRQGDINSARWFGDQELTKGGIASLLSRLQLQGGGYYSGTKDYGNDWSGSRAGVGGRVTVESPLQDYILKLMTKGYGYRDQVTSPEGRKDIYSGGKFTGGGVGLTDPRGRSVSVDYDRRRPRRFMFRGNIPVNWLSGGNIGVLPR